MELTTNEQVGPIAAKAEVTHLVLSHLVFFGEVTTEDWLASISGWDGEVTVAQDLQMISP